VLFFPKQWGAIWQDYIIQPLKSLQSRLPIPLLVSDFDNSSEFINAHLFRYCRL